VRKGPFLNSLLALDPKNAVAIANQGYAYFSKGDFAAAIANYSRALELDPKNAIGYFMRARAKCSNHDYDGAVTDYDRVLELDPKNTKAKNNRDRARLHQQPFSIDLLSTKTIGEDPIGGRISGAE